MFTLGLQRMGSIFALFVTEPTHFDLSISLRSCGRIEFLPLVLDSLRLGLSMLSQSMAPLGFTFSAMGLSRMELLLPALDSTVFGSSPPLRSFVCLGLLVSMCDAAHLGFPLLVRAVTCSDFTLSAWGVQAIGSLFFLPVIDYSYPDSSALPHSVSCSDSFLFVLDSLHLGFFVLFQSSARIGLAMPAFDFLRPDPLLLAHSFAHVGFAVLIAGLARCGSVSSPLVIEKFHLDLLSLLQSIGKLGFSSLAFDPLHLGPVVSMQSHTCHELILPVWGMASAGSVFSLLVMECAHTGLSLLVRSMICMNLAASALDFLRLGLMPFSRAFAHCDFFLLMCGTSRGGSLPVLDFLHPGLCLFPHSFSKMELAALVFDLLHMGPSASTRCCNHIGLVVSSFGLGRAGFVSLLSATSSAMLGSSLLSRSRVQVDFVAFVSDLLHMGFLLLLHAPSCVGFAALLWGLS